MAQRPHVPKFGNFESDNDIPYTAYFEKALMDRGNGARMNPNDPEENPEAFMINSSKGNGNINYSPVSSNKSTDQFGSVEKKQQRFHHRNTSRSTTTSESSSEKISNSDNFQNRNRLKSQRKKSMVESDYLVPPSPGPDKHKNSNNLYDMSYGSVSVPKFGAWDEKDPASGEGFTVIFNKVKEEKQIAASKFSVVPPQPATYTRAHKDKKNKLKPKMSKKNWCCIFPRGRD